MIDATGQRIRWPDLPLHVRSAVEDILGDRVVRATSQRGGFSPGSADRVVTRNGRRAFVKAVSPAQNPVAPGMYRDEARNTAALPPGTPAPDLLGHYDDGEWIALVLTDVDGRHPATPWTRPELDAVMTTLDTLAALPPIAGLPTAAQQLPDLGGGWRRLAENPPDDLDPWLRGRRPDPPRADVLAGDAIVHLDIRADNLLVGPAGDITVIDWPAACLGPRWLDRALLLINVRLYGGHDCEALLRAIDGDPDDMWSVLAGLAGNFLDKSRQPPPPGLPTLRAFQRAQADALIGWMKERHNPSSGATRSRSTQDSTSVESTT